MIAVIIGVALFTVAVSLADEKCKGGMINQELCQKTCNLSSCFCDMTDTSPFSSCTQKCHFSSSCPEMDCSGKPGFFSLHLFISGTVLARRVKEPVASSKLPLGAVI